MIIRRVRKNWRDIWFPACSKVGLFFRALLWPSQWSLKQPMGTKWKIWTQSFNKDPMVSYTTNSLSFTVGHFSKNQKSAEKSLLISGLKSWFLDTFFQNTGIQRWIKIFSSLAVESLKSRVDNTITNKAYHFLRLYVVISAMLESMQLRSWTAWARL